MARRSRKLVALSPRLNEGQGTTMRDQKVFLSAGMINYRLAGLEMHGPRQSRAPITPQKLKNRPEHQLESSRCASGWIVKCACGWRNQARDTKAAALSDGFLHLRGKKTVVATDRKARDNGKTLAPHLLQLHEVQSRWQAVCRCGWTSLPSLRGAIALANGQDHVRRAR